MGSVAAHIADQDNLRSLKRKAEAHFFDPKRIRLAASPLHLQPPLRLRVTPFPPVIMQTTDHQVLAPPTPQVTTDALDGALVVQSLRSQPFDPERIRNDLQAYRAEVGRRGNSWRSITDPIRSLYENLKVSVTEVLRYNRSTAPPPRPEWITAAETPRFVEVTPEEAAKVEYLLETVNEDPNTIVAEVDGITLTKRDMRCLRTGEWLNDEVINSYMNLLNARSRRLHEERQLPLAYHWSTFFYSSLTAEDSYGQREYTYNRVRRWTTRKKVDLFSMDLIFMPIHINKIHWALGCIDLRSKLVFFFDSLGGVADRDFFDTLLRYLNDEHQDKKGTPLPDKDKWMFAGNNFALSVFLPRSKFDMLTGPDAMRDNSTLFVDVPFQDNGSDCGVFACQYAESLGLLRFPFEFGSEEIGTRRHKMALQIMRGFIDS